MKTNLIIIVILLWIPIAGFCLTQNSKVSIITSEPGSELYTIFGHTAIRITDDSLNIDRVYNFGTFDFSTSFFYVKFLKGNLEYYLSINDYDDFLLNAQMEQRIVYEQTLNLNYNERLKMFNSLERQYNSDDRYYKYDFFYCNCATRVRDAILNAKTVPIEYDTSSYCCQTFRQLLNPYISKNYWVDFVINISLGTEADRIAQPNDYMFLPYYVMNIIEDSNIAYEKTLVLNASVSSNNNYKCPYLSPLLIASLIILLSLITKYRKTIFYLFTSIVGLIGLFLITVSLVTDNPAFSSNLNIYWTAPSLLLLLIRNRKINDIIKLFYITLLILLLIFWNILSQSFSITFIPWIITLIVILLTDLQWYKKFTVMIALLIIATKRDYFLWLNE